MEYYLVNDIGLDWDTLRGEKTVEYEEREPHGLLAYLKKTLPLCEDPEPIHVTRVRETDGIGHQDATRLLEIDKHVQEYREEQREEARRREERKSNNS